MGYTIENKKIVIWTEKRSVEDDWPHNDDVTNYTYFFKNLYDKIHFLECEACLPDTEKMLHTTNKEQKINTNYYG